MRTVEAPGWFESESQPVLRRALCIQIPHLASGPALAVSVPYATRHKILTWTGLPSSGGGGGAPVADN